MTTERKLGLASAVCCGLVAVLAALQLFHVWEQAYLCYPGFMALSSLCQAGQNRKQNRSLAVFHGVTAAVLVVLWILLFFVK